MDGPAPRLVILNLSESCLPAPDTPPDFAALHALEAALARLSHLLKDQRFLSLGVADPADLLAALFAPANAGLPFTAIFPPAPQHPSPTGEVPGDDAQFLPPLVEASGDDAQMLSPLAEASSDNPPPL